MTEEEVASSRGSPQDVQAASLAEIEDLEEEEIRVVSLPQRDNASHRNEAHRVVCPCPLKAMDPNGVIRTGNKCSSSSQSPTDFVYQNGSLAKCQLPLALKSVSVLSPESQSPAPFTDALPGRQAGNCPFMRLSDKPLLCDDINVNNLTTATCQRRDVSPVQHDSPALRSYQRIYSLRLTAGNPEQPSIAATEAEPESRSPGRVSTKKEAGLDCSSNQMANEAAVLSVLQSIKTLMASSPAEMTEALDKGCEM